MSKKLKIILVSALLIVCFTACVFIYQINKPHHYTPVTSEIILNNEESIKIPFLLNDGESEIEINLGNSLSFVSDIENNTANLEETQRVFGFYECEINRVYDEYIPVISYSSSNENIAKVDENGVVTATSKGKAIITVKADEISTQIPITINKVVMVEELEQNITMLTGETKNIISLGEYEVAFSDFHSSNVHLVTVSQQGVIEAISKGTAEIFTYTDQAKTQKISTKVTVKQPVESLTVYDMTVNQTSQQKVRVSYLPLTADYGTNLTYKTSDPSIATVSGNVVTGVKEGTTTITVTSGNGIVGQAKITVTKPPRANVSVVDVSKAEFDAYTGEKYSDNSPYATHIKISFDQPVIGFRINYITDNNNSLLTGGATSNTLTTGSAIYNNANLPANTPIYFEIMVNESDIFKTRGFSYTNLDGSTFYYALYESGADGSILFRAY